MSNVTILVDGIEAHSYTVETKTEELIEELEGLRSESGTLMVEIKELQEKIDEIKSVIGRSTPFTAPVPDGALSPSDSIQDFLRDGVTIFLTEGVYHQTLDFSGLSNVRLEAVEGHEVIITGLTGARWAWTQTGDVYSGSFPGFNGLWHHNDPATTFNTALAYPLLCTIGDEPLLRRESGSLNFGEFCVSSPADSAGTIKVRLRNGQRIEDFQISPFSRLVWGDNDTSGITIKNIKFKGCSNTSFTGAVNLPGKDWTLENVEVSLANTIGIELGLE